MDFLLKTAVVIGPRDQIDSRLMEELESRSFHVFPFESVEEFLFEGQFFENCVYFLHTCVGTISGNELIRMIRLKDKISLIYSVALEGFDVNLEKALLAGADFSVKSPLNIERCFIEIQNHFNKIDHLTKFRMKGGVELIPEASTVIRHGKVKKLTDVEFKIFSCLFEDLQKVFSREEITQFLAMKETTLRTVDVHISSLRRKLDSLDFSIETKRGKGYQLNFM